MAHSTLSSIPKTDISTNLDFLRAVAVLCVYIAHLLRVLQVAELGSLGQFGVVLFFVHTSLVLMQSMDRLQLIAESRSRLFAAFWLRRIFRIYPLSILVVTAIALFHLPPDVRTPYQWLGMKGLLANLLLIQNLVGTPDFLTPLWSLPLEIQMYLVLPFAHMLLVGARRIRALWLWAASIALALVLPQVNWRLSVAVFAPCFCSGIVAYHLNRSRDARTVRLPPWVWPLGVLLVIGMYVPLEQVNLYRKPYPAWILGLCVALLWVYVREARAGGIHRVFHWIADRSYSIYLTHIILFWFALAKLTGAPMWVRVLVIAVTSVWVPALLYRYVERPLMLLGAHISRRALHPHVQRTAEAR